MALLQEYPNQPQVLFSLAQVGIRSGAFKQVLPILVQCVALMPEESQPLLQLAQIYAELGSASEAETAYQDLVKHFPDWPNGYFSFAGFLQAEGELERAMLNLLKTIELAPEHSGAYLAISGLQTITKDQPIIDKMQILLERLEQQPSQHLDSQMKLNYALGKAMADIKDYSKAFSCWNNANKIQLQQCQFRVEQMLPFYHQIKHHFSGLTLQSDVQINTCDRSDKPTPIFILGMPRSGSTLLEQMLSQHSEIETAGEVNYISNIVVQNLQKMTNKQYPLGIKEVSSQQLSQLAEMYISQLQSHHPDARYIIDKLPANFQSIGLIRLLFPQAVIIHLTRNPMAIALSIFRNLFAANEPYFCDLDEFAQYYLGYQDLMAFWQTTHSEKIIQLSYEELVTSPVAEITRVLNECALKWQDQCLSFYRSDNRVNTLSDHQVRQPLYQSAVEDWQHYAAFMKDFASKLEISISES